MTQPLHAVLRGERERHETAEEAALHAQPVLSTVLVVGVEDLVGDPGHSVCVQSTDTHFR